MYRTPEVGGSADGVVVQRWYRERLVGDATATAARSEGGGREAQREGVQYDIINCSTMPPACRHGDRGGGGLRSFPLEPTNCAAVVRGKFH